MSFNARIMTGPAAAAFQSAYDNWKTTQQQTKASLDEIGASLRDETSLSRFLNAPGWSGGLLGEQLGIIAHEQVHESFFQPRQR